MNILALLIGLIIGIVLSHMLKDREFRVTIKHTTEFNGGEVTEEMLKEATKTETNEEIKTVMESVGSIIDELLYPDEEAK